MEVLLDNNASINDILDDGKHPQLNNVAHVLKTHLTCAAYEQLVDYGEEFVEEKLENTFNGMALFFTVNDNYNSLSINYDELNENLNNYHSNSQSTSAAMWDAEMNFRLFLEEAVVDFLDEYPYIVSR